MRSYSSLRFDVVTSVPLDHALGRAGGFGFDGRSGVERPETAKVIRELGGNDGKPTGAAPGRGRNPQDEPDPNER